MSTDPRWITEADVAAALPLTDAIAAIETMADHLRDGSARNINKAMARWDVGSVHSLGSVDTALGLTAFKNWVNTAEGASATMTVYDATSGRLRAVIEAGTMGALRTAAVAAVATKRMVPVDTDRAAILGSGRQAFLQLASVMSVRPVTEFTVWSPTAERRETFAKQAAALFGVAVTPVDSVRAATEGCRVVVTITRARTPFLSLEAVEPGTHVSAMGAILPGFQELADDLIDRTDRLVVDHLDAARAVSAEVQRFERTSPENTVAELHEQPTQPTASTPRLSVFKSVGMGTSDLALAARLLDVDAGTAFSHPTPTRPRLA